MITTISKHCGDFEALRWVSLAASTDTKRSSICGIISIEQDGDTKCAVAIDGKRLHKSTVSQLAIGLYKIIASKAKEMQLDLIEDKSIVYPNWRQVLPIDNCTLVHCMNTGGEFGITRMIQKVYPHMPVKIKYLEDVASDGQSYSVEGNPWETSKSPVVFSNPSRMAVIAPQREV